MTKQLPALAAAMLLYTAALEAQIQDTPELVFNGFGTAGMVHSDEEQADFVSKPYFVPEGAGHSDEWSAKVDSRLGLQLTANLTPRLTGVFQVVAEQRHDDTYTPTVEWANARFNVTPDLSVRAGRMLLPSAMASEYRKVGYANHWVRPPQEVYSIFTVTNIDGIELSYRSRFNGFTNTLQSIYGSKDSTLAAGGDVAARGITLADTLVWRATTAFIQYSSYRLTMESLNPLFDGFRQFGRRGEFIADQYDIDDKRFEVMAIGAQHDPGDWFVMGELVRLNTRTLVGDVGGWYVTGGYRVGDFTPYVTLARARAFGNTSDPGLPTTGLPPPIAAQAEGLNAALNDQLDAATQQKSLSIGVRWDFTRNAALKVQLDHIDLDQGSPGVLVNTQPEFEPGGRVNLLSVVLDFVF